MSAGQHGDHGTTTEGGNEDHGEHQGHGSHQDHGGHSGHGGHGDHAAMFRNRFWWSLLLSVPVVFTRHMIAGWLGYHVPEG
ncbi:MAG: heavy metal translocating P-type ATPase, partial [Nocardiopsis sp. BM-2018]